MQVEHQEPSAWKIVGILTLLTAVVVGVAALATEGVALFFFGVAQCGVVIPVIIWAAVTRRTRWLWTTLVFAGVVLLLNGVGCGILLMTFELH